MKISELNGPALDCWVARAAGHRIVETPWHGCWIDDESKNDIGDPLPRPFRPSTNWMEGGPIIERERLMICQEGDGWGASPPHGCWNPSEYSAREMGQEYGYGPTLLVAAMRAYVASRFGWWVPDIPTGERRFTISV